MTHLNMEAKFKDYIYETIVSKYKSNRYLKNILKIKGKVAQPYLNQEFHKIYDTVLKN